MKLHGVDVRIMDEEQAWHLNRLRMKQNIHIAWDLPQLDLRDRLKEMVKHVKPYKITCYVLIGVNSTIEQDLFRLNVLRELGITPFVIPFRDYGNERTPTRYERDLARCNRKLTHATYGVLRLRPALSSHLQRTGTLQAEYHT